MDLHQPFRAAEQLSKNGIAFTQGAEERYIIPKNGLVTSLELA